MTPDGVIQAAAASIANKIADTVPQDVGFLVILFHRGEQRPHIGCNVEHALALRVIEKARESVVRDARTIAPEAKAPWERPS